LAGRFYLANLMTLLRGATLEALQRGDEQVEVDDLARVSERCPARCAAVSRPQHPPDRRSPAQGETCGRAFRRRRRPAPSNRTRSSATWTKRSWTACNLPTGHGPPVSALSPRAGEAKRRPATEMDSSPRCLPAWDAVRNQKRISERRDSRHHGTRLRGAVFPASCVTLPRLTILLDLGTSPNPDKPGRGGRRVRGSDSIWC
jgi:hypothetical protein